VLPKKENNDNQKYNISYRSFSSINENLKMTEDNTSHRGEISHSKDEATTAIVLVKVSDNNKNSPIKMTKEQYDSWAGNENENEI
jgi:hypothetical protein